MFLGYVRRNALVVTAVVLATIVSAKFLTDRVVAPDDEPAQIQMLPDLDPSEQIWPNVVPPVLPETSVEPIPMPTTATLDGLILGTGDPVGPGMNEFYARGLDPTVPIGAYADVRARSPAGLEATDARISTAAPDTVLDRIADVLGVSTRTLEVHVEGETVPLVLSYEWSVAAGGRIVGTLTTVVEVLATSGLALAAFGIGCVTFLYRSYRTDGQYDAMEESGGMLLASFFLTQVAIIAGSVNLQRPSGETAFLVLIVVLSSMKHWRSRLLAMAWALFAISLFRLLQIEILAPHSDLTGAYGPLGVRGLDIVVLLAGQALFLGWRILRNVRFGPVVHVHQPTYPLVQDVRIVERR